MPGHDLGLHPDVMQIGAQPQAKRLDAMDTKLSGMDTRLRAVETRSAVFGAVSGGTVAVGMALIVEGLKGWLHRGP